MNALIKRAVVSVAGMVAVLAWWSLHPDDSSISSSDSIPSSVWGGGAAQLLIETTTNCPAYVSVSFEGTGDAWSEQGLLETHENIEAGTHSWTIDVPEQVGGFVELGSREPSVGNALSWRLFVDGRLVDEQSESLQEELEPNYAFFLQMAFDDYGDGRLAEDW